MVSNLPKKQKFIMRNVPKLPKRRTIQKLINQILKKQKLTIPNIPLLQHNQAKQHNRAKKAGGVAGVG